MANERPQTQNVMNGAPSGGMATSSILDFDYTKGYNPQTGAEDLNADPYALYGRTPKYTSGADIGDVVRSFDASQTYNYQQSLVNAGFIDEVSYPGIWDPNSLGALQSLMDAANRAGGDATWMDVLQMRIDDPAQAAKRAKKSSGTTRTVQLPNGDDVRAAIQSAVRAAGGKDLSDEEVRAWAQDYIGQARSENAPAVDTYAENRLQADHPDDFYAHRMMNTFNTFMQLSRGGQ